MNEKKNHILSVLVENSAGVLSQVSRMFSRKGYNIASLAVGETEDPAVSRMTILVYEDEAQIEQIASQLAKLLPVISVRILNRDNSIRRELLLVKVKADTRETRDEIIQMASIFRVKIVDVAHESLTLEVTGDFGKSEALLKLLEGFGILELVRTGTVALERGKDTIYDV
ncbi:MAG: acetolactate synthase small subunit [Oscillospiraceae bacterium]|nr:acetolactate synthase small subunit [Oscillospiraceae bacterium]